MGQINRSDILAMCRLPDAYLQMEGFEEYRTKGREVLEELTRAERALPVHITGANDAERRCLALRWTRAIMLAMGECFDPESVRAFVMDPSSTFAVEERYVTAAYIKQAEEIQKQLEAALGA